MDFVLARKNMVESQIRTNRVTSLSVINAFREVPRERFVPTNINEVSYNDEEINLYRNRYMMKPMLLARFFQELNFNGNETVLHIGSNTGYASAVLSKLCSAVITIESDKKLYEKSIEVLSELSFDNVVPLHGLMEMGVPDEAPFDVIFIEGAIEEHPKLLFDQLLVSGQLATVLRPYNSPLGKGVIFYKHENSIGPIELFDAQCLTLPIFKTKSKFVFNN